MTDASHLKKKKIAWYHQRHFKSQKLLWAWYLEIFFTGSPLWPEISLYFSLIINLSFSFVSIEASVVKYLIACLHKLNFGSPSALLSSVMRHVSGLTELTYSQYWRIELMKYGAITQLSFWNVKLLIQTSIQRWD